MAHVWIVDASYRRQERISPCTDPGFFFEIIRRLTVKDEIKKYVDIDRPYDMGNISQPEKDIGMIPKSISVQAITGLTLCDPRAHGYLVFKREEYVKKLCSEFDKLS